MAILQSIGFSGHLVILKFCGEADLGKLNVANEL